MTPQEAEKALSRLSRGLEAAGKRAVNASLREAQREAKRLSSGTVPTSQLRREDHPYARRHGSPRRDPAVINRQTFGPALKAPGPSFYESWQLTPAAEDGDGVAGAVENVSPQAQYLDAGTATMFERPLVSRVLNKIGPRLERRFADEVGRLDK